MHSWGKTPLDQIMKTIRKLNFFKFTQSGLGMLALSASFFRNEGRPVFIHLLRQMYLTGGRPTKAGITAIGGFLRSINLLKTNMGIPGVVKYLKGCSVLVQQISAGYRIPDTSPLGLRIKRTKSGVPLLVPKPYRKAILNGDATVIRLMLTLFSCYRNMEYEGEVKLSTIVNPGTGLHIEKDIPRFIHLFIKGSKVLPVGELFHITTSSPTVIGKEEFSSSISPLIRAISWYEAPQNRAVKDALFHILSFCKSTAIQTLYLEASIYKDKYETSDIALAKAKISQLKERAEVIKFPTRKLYNLFAKTFLGKKFNPAMKQSSNQTFIGKLAIKPEPAGKMRVFAMVDAWTQWALNPLHKWIFNILKNNICDGTFNQLGPLGRVPFGKEAIYSFDLSAATDRLPISIQESLLKRLFGRDFAKAWSTLLIHRGYKISHLWKDYPYLIKYGEFVKYSVGQPMGALSSWAMLALTHHYLIQVAAWNSGFSKSQLFTKYAVLGDDVCIWDTRVASAYQKIMETIGVELGLAKSIISPLGLGLEFAKRTIVRGHDMSPFPMSEAKASHGSMAALSELKRKYSLSDLSLIRWLGYGPHVTMNSGNFKIKVLSLIRTIPRTPQEFIAIFTMRVISFFKEDYYHRDLLLKDLVILTYKEIESLYKRVKEEHLRVVHAYVALDISNPLFEGSKQHALNRLTLQIKGRKMQEYIEELGTITSKLKSTLYVMSPLYQTVTLPNFPLPPYGFYANEAHRIYISASITLLFKSLNRVDSMSINDLLSPSRSISRELGIFPGWESKSKIRFWNHWFRIFLKRSLQRNLEG